MRNKLSPLFICLLAACAAKEDGCSSPGELGRARFSYVSGNECQFGCNMEAPMMLGTSEMIRVRPEETVSKLVAESSNPAAYIVTSQSQRFQCVIGEGTTRGLPDTCESDPQCKIDCLSDGGSYRAVLDLGVETKSAATSTLIVKDEGGEVFDRIELSVKVAKSVGLGVAVKKSEDEIESITLAAGDDLKLKVGGEAACHARALDENGDLLRASVAKVSTTDPAILRMDPDRATDPNTNGGTLAPLSVGTVGVMIETGGVSGRVDVRIE